MLLQKKFAFLLLFLSCITLSGCIQQNIDEALFTPYNNTTLGQSSSGNVLIVMDEPQTTLLSQSDTVVASWGQAKKGYQQWLNVVAFDEETADAVRKYFVFVDERARIIPLLHPKWSTRFDAQLMLNKTVLEKPYPDEKIRSIAILKEIQKQFAADIAKVSSDNKMLGVCQMLINENIEDAARQLDESPGLAAKLDTAEGWEFDSRNFFTNLMHMHEEGGIVNIKMQLGAIPWKKAESEPGSPYGPSSVE